MGDYLTPADVQTVAFALRLVHRTVDADPLLAGALETARGQVCRAAESWYVALGRDADTASSQTPSLHRTYPESTRSLGGDRPTLSPGQTSQSLPSHTAETARQS